MRKRLSVLFSVSIAITTAQNVAINGSGAAPAASAMLDISSTTSGLLIPRMTTVQRAAIATPATGLYVFDTTTGSFWYYNGTIWVEMTSSTTGWLLAGNTLAGTERLGSNNAQPVRFFSNGTERARILATGEMVVGNTVPFAGDVFSSYGAFAINGYCSVANGAAVYGNASATGALSGFFNATGSSIIGMLASTSSSVGFGGYARNLNVSGTGLMSIGNAGTGNFLTAGSGGAFNGIPIGIAAFSGNTNTNGNAGGYFVGNTTGQFAYVSTRVAATWYKINGTGTVASILRNQNGPAKNVFCPEAPEILLQDYGVGQLVNGKAHIAIDEVLSKNITVNEQHPLRVYITLKGECNGVFVTNENDKGFDVIELANGKSNAKFNYQLVANRADEVDASGEVMSKNADVRFPDSPSLLPMGTSINPTIEKRSTDK